MIWMAVYFFLLVPMTALAIFQLKNLNHYNTDPIFFVIFTFFIICVVIASIIKRKIIKGYDEIDISEFGINTIRWMAILETLAFYFLFTEFLVAQLSHVVTE